MSSLSVTRRNLQKPLETCASNLVLLLEPFKSLLRSESMTGMTTEDYRAAGEALYQAEMERAQIGLLSQRFPLMNLDDAYAVQDHLVAMREAAGFKRVGWKIGLTSRAMQEALQI